MGNIVLPTPDKVEMKATRFGYGEAICDLGETNEAVVVLDADLAKSTTTYMFQEKFPHRFFDMGIAEQNMLGTAGGLSIAGKIPYVTTYGTFVVGRAYDQIRTTVCYSNLNVKIGGAHGGISVGPDGATHQALEEITAMRVMPNMKVLVPCDASEAYKVTVLAAELQGPVYMRFGREKVPNYTTETTPFEFGRAEIFREGTDVAVIACGTMVYEGLRAAEQLQDEGVSVRVINCHTIKPIDTETIVRAAKECGAIVTAEEHQMFGGFGSAVAEVVVQHHAVPMRFVAIEDRFGESGQPEELMDEFGLTRRHIADKIRDVLRK